MSKLLLTIDQRLSSESDEYVRAELIARKAAYLARVGAFDEARRYIADVRTQFGDGRSGRVTVLLMIAESLLIRFETLGVQALDRINRAQLLAQAGRDHELIALTSAWKGYLEFERSDFDASARSLRLATSSCEENDHSPLCRVAGVLVMAFSICGDLDSALHHFQVGREHALADGDQAAVEGLLHNKAIFGAAYLRAQNCLSPVLRSELERSRVEIRSARNLQQLAGVKSFGFFADLAESRLLIVEGNYEEALRRTEKLRDQSPLPTAHITDETASLERVFCLAKSGRTAEALGAHRPLSREALHQLDADDRLVASWQTLQLVSVDPRFGDPIESQLIYDEAVSAYDELKLLLARAYAEWASK